MKEHQRAQAWRESLDLSIADLALLTGYSPLAIRFFEKGETPSRSNAKSGPHSKTAWKRYKNICAGVDAQRRTKRQFNW